MKCSAMRTLDEHIACLGMIDKSHEWNPTSTTELVHWSGVPICHGSLDGRPHTIHARWQPNDPRFDPVIADNISNSRWVMIKKYFKLNNNLAGDPKRGMKNYDPYISHGFNSLVLIQANYDFRLKFVSLKIFESLSYLTSIRICE